ncbi:MAG TPA: hypothetical protein VNO23_03410 [Candidatus Binatia bacterium]|nr:hypothetical protein [Candidatus Binatia bacterium]
MTECKHSLKHGCAYCHAPTAPAGPTPSPTRRRGRSERLSEQMNDRVGRLKKRLREIRGG